MRKWILSLLLLAGCQSDKEVFLEKSTISLNKNRFYHTTGGFSVGLPRACVNPTCQELTNGNVNAIIFKDQVGHLVKVETSKMSDELLTNIALQCSREERVELLKGIFHDCVLPLWKQASPKLEIVVEEDIALEDDRGVFVLLYAAECSTLLDPITYQRADAWRGYLLSFVDNQIVIISEQETLFLLLPTLPKDLNPPKEKIMKDLINIHKSFQIESGC